MESTSHKVRVGSGDERSASTEISILGSDDLQPTTVISLNRESLIAAALVPPDSEKAASADQYRVMKRDLLRYCGNKNQESSAPPQFIMITSAQPGDGKTFTSVNLALSMTSERDHDVLLIDGDVAKQDITRNFGAGELPGLLDALRDPKRKFLSVIYPTSVPRLKFLPAGSWSDDATELVSSQRMRQFMSELSTRYPQRLVVLDSSPALLLPDAQVFSALVGQVVLVVKAGTTLQHDAKEAAAMVSGLGRRLTLVLNQLESNDLLDSVIGYRYGYGYGYGHAYGSEARNKSVNDPQKPGG